MEPEPLKICPYVPSHRIPASRFQYHIASCKKKNPKIAKKMANCKYNACHVVPIGRLKEHEAGCINRPAEDDEPFVLPEDLPASVGPKEKPSGAAGQAADPDVWDVDEEDHFPSFVLKTFTPKTLVCQSDSRDPREDMEDKYPNNNRMSWRKDQ